ncbi:hypothetical protein SAMN05892877_11468 [Rhizobium subbaraonis]|uniref:Uncharacterized protein n=1 Tax=Rhizobium subbaraonis TaxID=908946 RepID=A0A285UTU3_9HYPH|nr:hypothetical protein [Rhizobium subbaraonis]SOC45223.1 hypothetical protein SAMN05892877_11468 [Rhizobium subbaraonis]
MLLRARNARQQARPRAFLRHMNAFASDAADNPATSRSDNAKNSKKSIEYKNHLCILDHNKRAGQKRGELNANFNFGGIIRSRAERLRASAIGLSPFGLCWLSERIAVAECIPPANWQDEQCRPCFNFPMS